VVENDVMHPVAVAHVGVAGMPGQRGERAVRGSE
jgi:hypothetical protein